MVIQITCAFVFERTTTRTQKLTRKFEQVPQSKCLVAHFFAWWHLDSNCKPRLIVTTSTCSSSSARADRCRSTEQKAILFCIMCCVTFYNTLMVRSHFKSNRRRSVGSSSFASNRCGCVHMRCTVPMYHWPNGFTGVWPLLTQHLVLGCGGNFGRLVPCEL